MSIHKVYMRFIFSDAVGSADKAHKAPVLFDYHFLMNANSLFRSQINVGCKRRRQHPV